MDSDAPASAWILPLADEAFAQLRSLIRSYLRGDISQATFEEQAAVVQLRYDMSVAAAKMEEATAAAVLKHGAGASRHALDEKPNYEWPHAECDERPEDCPG